MLNVPAIMSTLFLSVAIGLLGAPTQNPTVEDPYGQASVAPAGLHDIPVPRHFDLGDIRMFCQIAGSGPAIVLLHGGFGSSETWRPYFSLLSDAYMVVAPDSRGQGRTTLGTGPVSYGRMAGDVVRLLDALGLAQAHIVGHSDGGATLFHLLTDYPDRILSATLIGAPYNITNYSPEGYSRLKGFVAGLGTGKSAIAQRLRSQYAALSPSPDAWPELVRRLGRTWLTLPTFTNEQLSLINTPVLIVKVDRDQFLPATFFDSVAKVIPRAELLYMGEATHNVPAEKPQELARGIRGFIEKVGPKSAAPEGYR